MRKSGTLQFKGSPRVGHNLATQQQQLTGVLGTDLFLCKMVRVTLGLWQHSVNVNCYYYHCYHWHRC